MLFITIKIRRFFFERLNKLIYKKTSKWKNKIKPFEEGNL